MGPESDRAIDLLDEYSYGSDYSVIGPRDNRVHETRTKQFPFNTICHIERDFGDGKWRGCSAVLISSRLVLTAGHCIYSPLLGKAPMRIRVTPGRSDRDTAPYGSVIAQRYFAPFRYINGPISGRSHWRDYDYGIILLPETFPGISRFMEVHSPTASDLSRVKRTKLLTIAGYPADRPVGTLWHHSEMLFRVTPRRLFYTVDTCPGHSGSPIWIRDGERRQIIGIHTSGPVDETGRAYGCSRGTVLAPHGLANSGVRITDEILEDIYYTEGTASAANRMVRLP